MAAHFDDALTTLEVIGYQVKKSDRDGMELHCTSSESPKEPFFTTKKILEEARKHDPRRKKEGRPGLANMRETLGTLIDAYRVKIDKSHGRAELFPKKLIMYVLTTGDWQPGSEVERNIVQLVQSLKQNNVPESHVGIQFIQFGDSVEANALLERYDNLQDHRDEVSREFDIVDNEPFAQEPFNGGNVWKFILGSINKWADRSNEPLPSRVQSPTTPQRSGHRYSTGSHEPPASPPPFPYNKAWMPNNGPSGCV